MWFYAKQNENPQGPFSEDIIRKLIVDGVITNQHQLFNHGTNKWMTLSQAGFTPPSPPGYAIGNKAVCVCMNFDENALVAVAMKKKEVSCLGWLFYLFLSLISAGLFVIWVVFDWMFKQETPHCVRCGAWLPPHQLR